MHQYALLRNTPARAQRCLQPKPYVRSPPLNGGACATCLASSQTLQQKFSGQAPTL